MIVDLHYPGPRVIVTVHPLQKNDGFIQDVEWAAGHHDIVIRHDVRQPWTLEDPRATPVELEGAVYIDKEIAQKIAGLCGTAAPHADQQLIYLSLTRNEAVALMGFLETERNTNPLTIGALRRLADLFQRAMVKWTTP